MNFSKDSYRVSENILRFPWEMYSVVSSEILPAMRTYPGTSPVIQSWIPFKVLEEMSPKIYSEIFPVVQAQSIPAEKHAKFLRKFLMHFRKNFPKIAHEDTCYKFSLGFCQKFVKI